MSWFSNTIPILVKELNRECKVSKNFSGKQSMSGSTWYGAVVLYGHDGPNFVS